MDIIIGVAVSALIVALTALALVVVLFKVQGYQEPGE
jgi:hypothetical protein